MVIRLVVDSSELVVVTSKRNDYPTVLLHKYQMRNAIIASSIGRLLLSSVKGRRSASVRGSKLDQGELRFALSDAFPRVCFSW